MSALMKHLFENQSYNPVIRPTLDHTTATLVTVEMVILAVVSLDTKEQIIKTNGFIRAVWKDELLQWDPSKYGHLDNLVIPQTMIWIPDALIVNVVNDNRYLGDETTRLRVNHNGIVNWEPGFNTETTCQMDISKYPFDVNICDLHLVTWMSDNTTVKLQLTNDPLRFPSTVANGEYSISPAHSIKNEFYAASGLVYDALHFHIRLERRPGFFILSLLIPVMLLSILGSVSFLLEPDEQEKLNVSITVLLSFTVFLDVIDNNLPTTSINLSFLVVYVSSMFAIGFFGVLGNVIVIKVHRWEVEGQLPTSDGQQDNRLSRRASPIGRVNRSISLLADSDNRGNHSHNTMKHPDNHARFGRSVLARCIKHRKGTIAQFLNKLFFYITISLVFIMTIGLWLLELT